MLGPLGPGLGFIPGLPVEDRLPALPIILLCISHFVSSLWWPIQVQQLSKMEVEDLLRKGAYGALMDEEDEGSKFCEEDIDQILQRRTHTITIQSEGKGSTFAKV